MYEEKKNQQITFESPKIYDAKVANTKAVIGLQNKM